jgi:hypothetical protein
MEKSKHIILRIFATIFFAVLINSFGVVKNVHANDSDFWKIANYEQKYIFVAGLRSGLHAASNRTQKKYESINALSKDLQEQDGKIVSRAAMDVWSDLNLIVISIHLDEKFIPDFIKFLDYYFTNPKNKNVGDALAIFLSDRLKNK